MARGFEKSPVYQPRGTNNGFCHEGWKSMKSAVGIFIYDGYDFYCPPTTHNSRRTIADSREMRVGAAGSRQKIFWFYYKVMCFKSYTRGGGRGSGWRRDTAAPLCLRYFQHLRFLYFSHILCRML